MHIKNVIIVGWLRFFNFVMFFLELFVYGEKNMFCHHAFMPRANPRFMEDGQ